MKTTIIIPTVRVPHNLHAWSQMLDPKTDRIIVVGSGKTPHNDVQQLLEDLAVPTMYLHPDSQHVTRWSIERHLQRNHHHRRNLALLEALTERPDVVITIDDDNYPEWNTWVSHAKELLTQPNIRPVIHEPSGWFNVGSLCEPHVVHRGFPLARRHESDGSTFTNPNDERIGVVAGLWLGDPDIDAVERIAVNPRVTDVYGSVTLGAGTWCPFDSQSTAVAGALAPMLYMWTSVGRYDDIFASYMMRAVMDPFDWHVTYGEPTVTQERNETDAGMAPGADHTGRLIHDLRNELYGYEQTMQLTELLRRISGNLGAMRSVGAVDSTILWGAWKYVAGRVIEEFEPLPGATVRGLQAWMKDVDEIMREW